MKYIFFSVVILFAQQNIYSQPKYIYFKVESKNVESNEKAEHSICVIYISGDTHFKTQPIKIPTCFLAFRCDSAQLIGVGVDCASPYPAISFPATFSCGDSVIVNITDETWEVINQKN